MALPAVLAVLAVVIGAEGSDGSASAAGNALALHVDLSGTTVDVPRCIHFFAFTSTFLCVN